MAKAAKKKPAAKARKKATAKPKSKVVAKPIQSATSGRIPRGQSREQRFIDEYLIDLNGRQAAIRAGYSPEGARFRASELLAKPTVQAKIQAAKDARSERTGITADRVLEQMWAVATADPMALMELRRNCCRYCYGIGHHYQFVQPELDEVLAKHEWEVETAAGNAVIRPPDVSGGAGFNPTLDPHPQCPVCFGEGVERVLLKDSRDVALASRRLFAGVKQTQHGIEIKTHDQMTQLLNVGKHLGMFKEKMELTGPNGKALAPGVIIVPAKGGGSVGNPEG